MSFFKLDKDLILVDQRVAASIVTDVLLELKALTAPGVQLAMLDELAERMIRERGGTPYNKGYKPEWAIKPFPGVVCMSVNHEACHAPAGTRTLREGDIVTYDLGVRYLTGCGDAALTVAVGSIDNRKQRLMRHALQALYEGIKVVRAGEKIGKIGEAIEKFAGLRGYNVLRQFGSHHIGSEMHEEPYILNYTKYDDPHYRTELKEGAVICIEPLLTPGKGDCAINVQDGWTAFAKDGQPVAMFEHQILVKKDGYEILTHHI